MWTRAADFIMPVDIWTWLLFCLAYQYDVPEYESDTVSYTEYTDYRRPRNENLRKWTNDHTTRQAKAVKRGFDVGPVAKSHFFLRCGKLTGEQRRWVL